MDLSPGEEAIVELFRGEPAIDFAMTVYRSGDVWTVSISSESDGILAGQGDTFRHALHVAFGVDGTSDDGEPVHEPARVLRLVGGKEHRAADAQNEMGHPLRPWEGPTPGLGLPEGKPGTSHPGSRSSVPAARRGGAHPQIG